jgi:hypothetical protein
MMYLTLSRISDPSICTSLILKRESARVSDGAWREISGFPAEISVGGGPLVQRLV